MSGLLIGRSAAPDTTGPEQMRYAQALDHFFATLPCPVLVDLDIGHQAAQMQLINGARAELQWRADATWN